MVDEAEWRQLVRVASEAKHAAETLPANTPDELAARNAAWDRWYGINAKIRKFCRDEQFDRYEPAPS